VRPPKSMDLCSAGRAFSTHHGSQRASMLLLSSNHINLIPISRRLPKEQGRSASVLNLVFDAGFEGEFSSSCGTELDFD